MPIFRNERPDGLNLRVGLKDYYFPAGKSIQRLNFFFTQDRKCKLTGIQVDFLSQEDSISIGLTDDFEEDYIEDEEEGELE